MDYWLSFVAGLFGSMHCVGMCGAIVLAYTVNGIPSNATRISTLAAHLTYNAGRVLSYVIVGTLLGFAGRGLAALEGVAYWFSLVVGILLVLAGVILLRIIPSFGFAQTVDLSGQHPSFLERTYRASFGILVALPKLESKFYIGLLTPLLPCGLLYSMFLKAAGTGSPVKAGMTMLLFGLGIVPALVLTGFAGSFAGSRIRQWADRVAALTILLMGLVMVARALGAPLPFSSTHHH